MKHNPFGVSRRRFLQGVGAAVALPAFESILRPGLCAAAAPTTAPIAATATGAPLRMAFIYFPNGAIQPNWWPTGEGKAFELARTMKPLAAVKQYLQVF